MLIYFKIGNYRSIKEPVVINFTAASISEHTNNNIIQEGKETLLRTILLYGHNASGKSNIMDGFAFLRHFIINSAIENQHAEEIENVQPFLLSELTEKNPSFVEARFIIGDITYRYGFEADKKEIHKEWLFESTAKKEYMVFLRMGSEFEIDRKRFTNSQGLEGRTRKNALFLSVASQWNQEKAQQINEWFAGSFAMHGLMDEEFNRNTIEFLQNKKYSDIIKRFIRQADLGIRDVGLIDIPLHTALATPKLATEFKTGRTVDFKTVFTLHSKFDKDNKEVAPATLYMEEHASAGTKKYFNLIGTLIYAIMNDHFVLIDELDAGLHSLLAKSIIKLFNDAGIKTKAQLIVATHDTTLLDRDLLRRDQIYFAEKDSYGATHVTSLVEFKPRKEAPYDKNYLDGKYGAIPFIENLSSLFYE